METKICSKCKIEKPIDEFYRAERNSDGKMSQCKTCNYKYVKEYRKRPENVDRIREQNRAIDKRYHSRPEIKMKHAERWHIKEYGISLQDREVIMKEQDGKCAVCGDILIKEGNKTCLDHNHITGKIRGIVCHNCNCALGYIKDNSDIAEAMVRYLQK
jgi:hypothetical protein